LDTAYFELNFKPNVQLVSVVRRFVTEFYQRFLNDPDGTSRVALATHELLENAVKYSRDGETTIRIEVSNDAPKRVTIQLRNRAELAHIAAIREIVDGVTKADDATAFYHQLIASKARNKSAGSGLGLARICAEAEMTINYDVQGDTVLIEASTAMTEGGKQ
jgi:hypothetical protein